MAASCKVGGDASYGSHSVVAPMTVTGTTGSRTTSIYVKVKRRRVLSQVLIGADRQPITDVVVSTANVIGKGTGSRDRHGRHPSAVNTPISCHETTSVDGRQRLLVRSFNDP